MFLNLKNTMDVFLIYIAITTFTSYLKYQDQQEQLRHFELHIWNTRAFQNNCVTILYQMKKNFSSFIYALKWRNSKWRQNKRIKHVGYNVQYTTLLIWNILINWLKLTRALLFDLVFHLEPTNKLGDILLWENCAFHSTHLKL